MDHAGQHTLHQLRHGQQLNCPIVTVRGADGEEHKLHPGYMHPVAAPSILQRLKARLSQAHHVSWPVCLALCFLCLWGGSNLSFESTLPTPTGGPGGILSQQASQKSTSRSLKFSSGAAQQLTAAEARAPAAVSHKSIITESDISVFQDVALNRSGFLNVRPAIGHGASGEDNMRAVPFQVISWYPRITYYPGFLDLQQTEHVIALAKTFMTPSSLAYRPGESIPESQEVRTSTGCFLAAEMDRAGVLAQVEDKIAAVTHLPVEHGEAFNVLRYNLGQHYDSHLDAFDPTSYGKQASQRIATMLIFLQAPEEGGETIFKREGENGGNRTVADWRTCADNLGIKVMPKSGDAVLFWSATVDQQLDPRSLHGACPVVRGQKWSMAKWIRDKPSGARRHNGSTR